MSLPSSPSALDRACSKAFLHLLPLLFGCYVIAYVDRVNVSLAKLNMQKDLAHLGFSESAFGFGMGVFFVGYLVLAIPGTLLVEKWSARKCISCTMIFWGFIAATTAFVHYWVPVASDTASWIVQTTATLIDPLAESHLGWLSSQAGELTKLLRRTGWCLRVPVLGSSVFARLAEAGFYPGVIVFLTHWFPRRDRSRALAWFFIGTPIAQIVGPPVCGAIMAIGVGDNPPILGLVGWQWVYIFWGAPAMILGFVVLATLPDRPHEARWLDDEECTALESELRREKQEQSAQAKQLSVLQALAHPRVLALAVAYFFVVTGNYGIEMYMASILRDWYQLEVQRISWLVIIPAIGSLAGQIFVGWNSDRTRERRWHASLPIICGASCPGTDTSYPGRTLADNHFLHARHDRIESLSSSLLDVT